MKTFSKEPVGCFISLAELLKCVQFAWNKFSQVETIFPNLSYGLCYKLDNSSASQMQSCYLISDTNYIYILHIHRHECTPSANLQMHESYLGSSPGVVKHPWAVSLTSQLQWIATMWKVMCGSRSPWQCDEWNVKLIFKLPDQVKSDFRNWIFNINWTSGNRITMVDYFLKRRVWNTILIGGHFEEILYRSKWPGKMFQ